MTIPQIRTLLTNAKLGRALDATSQLSAVLQDEDLSTTVTMLQARYNSNKKNKMLGIIEDSGARREEAQITHGLLGLLSDLEEDQGMNAPSAQPSSATITASGMPPTTATATGGDDGVTKILFLASNPSDTAKLQLTHEHSSVSSRLQEAPAPEKYPLKFRRAVTPSEFSEFLYLEKPDIVHFSGHGDRQAPAVREMMENSRAGRQEASPNPQKEEESGIFLMDEDKRHAKFVNTAFLHRTFRTMVERQNIPIKAVVFNACHSSQQAEAISKVVPYVVGTSWSVGDKAAIAFASGFYFGIAQGKGIEDAVDFGIIQALAYGEPEDRFLLYKDGHKVDFF